MKIIPTLLKAHSYILCISILLLLPACTSLPRTYITAPTQLPNTYRQMKTPGFWISNLKTPDKTILDPEQVRSINSRFENEKLTHNLLSFKNQYDGYLLKNHLSEVFVEIKKKHLFTMNGHIASPSFFLELRNKARLETIEKKIPLRHAITVNYTHQRILPTSKPLFAKNGDIDFDELQNSALDIGTPVIVLHESSDAQWVYAISPLSEGWLHKTTISFCTFDQFKSFVQPDSFIIVTCPKADIFTDKTMTDYNDYLRMGSRLPLIKEPGNNLFHVILPQQDQEGNLRITDGYISSSKSHEGFLPYTQRTIIEQAFSLLNTPYGWGGMYGEQDCSRFLQEIFASTGIFLPRNSSAQALSGYTVASFSNSARMEDKKRQIVKKAVPGLTLLYMKGHIMLYLGNSDNHLYAIHATWGYREAGDKKDRIRLINRVAVTDLELGKGSRKGALLERLQSVIFIGTKEEYDEYLFESNEI